VSVYKRGQYYWYSFWFKGKRIQQGTHTTNRREAQKLEAVHKARVIEGKSLMPSKRIIPPFSELASRYLEYSKANKRSYVADFYYITRVLSPYFDRFLLSDITPLMVEEFKQKRLRDGLKKSSINRELGLFKSMLNTAVRWQIADSNGARDVRQFKLDEPPVERVLSHEEELRILAACETCELAYRAPHLKAIILIALYTGLRRGEILRLRWADIDFDNFTLLVRRSKTIAGQGRKIYLNSILRHLMEGMRKDRKSEWVFPSPERFQQMEGTERHIGDVKHGFQRAVKLSRIPHITFHQLRHTFCTRLASAGVSLSVIQELAGHASILMTRRYTHPSNELKQRAVELLTRNESGARSATQSATVVPALKFPTEVPGGQVAVSQEVRIVERPARKA
jgi:integrase